jgi:hypothetical protein
MVVVMMVMMMVMVMPTGNHRIGCTLYYRDPILYYDVLR